MTPPFGNQEQTGRASIVGAPLLAARTSLVDALNDHRSAVAASHGLWNWEVRDPVAQRIRRETMRYTPALLRSGLSFEDAIASVQAVLRAQMPGERDLRLIQSAMVGWAVEAYMGWTSSGLY